MVRHGSISHGHSRAESKYKVMQANQNERYIEGPAKNFHGVVIGPLSKILAVKVNVAHCNG